MEPAIFADDATELAAKLVEVADMLDKLEVLNPEAMLLEPRAVYDVEACIEVVMRWLDCSAEEAADWVGFNTTGAWIGQGTPTFNYMNDGDAEEAEV